MTGKKMRALVFYGPKNFKVEEMPIPQISKDEILVKVKYAGVCGTDNRIYQGTKKINPPRITGHEFVGEIVEVGKNIKEFSVEERVTVYPMISCGMCYACKAGRKNICTNRITIGYEIDGGFAQYIKIPSIAIKSGNVIKVPENLRDEVVAISEPIAAAYHGIKRCEIKEGQTVIIVGAGPIGLFHTQLASLNKPSRVIVIEPIEEKRSLALRMGATDTIDPINENVLERVLEITNREGADVVIIDVGIPKVIEDSLAYVKKGGTFLVFAGCPEGSRINIDPNVIHYREINFTGSSASTPEIHREVLELLSAGKLNVENLISEILPLDKWQQAFEMKNNYIGIKVLIDPWME
ncbi:MAG: L-iditol 2-dehydrogenase [Epulopiscium sp.]|jgi:L-iditol 2-dehydrogenase|nr:L-iditol 2-dehydrogenase [Thermoanaerobacter sp.]MDK2788255.1 L-iditol 2-dehydrogenase [Candidatus Epulonipiscium sp.]MDK2824796.1 L-iditol 2-dehydrogenase [Clostridia bacterium]MDK2920354.1 L-iditol 2-dehydrogenase [Candidatus Petromonas sp.]